ncbi:MAG: 1-acyl-sn-glycerol-3-phosphate acyltransferase [Clostridia bacterium]|nr:1-acyl-sn-glycerol-3-phosphate acyltransferase [Clostridia bacterium]
MLYAYIVASAAITLFSGVTTASGSIWKTPLMLIGCFVGFVIVHAAVFFLAILAVNPKKKVPKAQTKFLRAVIKYTLPAALTLARVTVHITGLEKVPEGERFLLVCNHIHNIDPAIIIYALPDAELSFVGKKEIEVTMPFVYKAFKGLNCILIDRENNREGAKAIIEACRLIKEDVSSIGIFPEGYTSLDGNLQPFRNGALKIATKTGSKIVVCSLVGTKEAIKNIILHRSHIYLDIIDVIDTADNTNTNELGDKIHAEMLENINNRKSNKGE